MTIKGLFLKSVIQNRFKINSKIGVLKIKRVGMNYIKILIGSFLMVGSALNLRAQDLVKGKKIYETRCLVCHQADGGGVPNMNAPLDGSSNVVGNDLARLVRIIKGGYSEKVALDGLYYSNAMTANPDLTDADIANVLSYIRTSWSNKASVVTTAQVSAAKSKK
jgi:mono/diheme cytochrome c family protein